ncbi:MAG: hypothetical protein MRZ18_08045, partial [Clostridiales bacterium]|nr:hypothetical protein [Clostridiales bacterium]
LLALVLTDEQWLKYSMSQMLQMAQVFVSKSGSNIGCHVAQIFIDIHSNGIFTATPTERITHYTLLRKVVCQMGALPPLETPHKKRRYATPLRGAYRLLLLSSPPAVAVEQKSAWEWCGIFI